MQAPGSQRRPLSLFRGASQGSDGGVWHAPAAGWLECSTSTLLHRTATPRRLTYKQEASRAMSLHLRGGLFLLSLQSRINRGFLAHLMLAVPPPAHHVHADLHMGRTRCSILSSKRVIRCYWLNAVLLANSQSGDHALKQKLPRMTTKYT